MAPPAPLFRGPWNDWTKTDFGRAKIKLTGHFDRGPIYRSFEPCHVLQYRDYFIFEPLKESMISYIFPYG